METPVETARREAFEETGIEIKIIGPTYDNLFYQPIATERYVNKVGDMIDIQYLAIPMSNILKNNENNEVKWFSFEELESAEDIDNEIKIKVSDLYRRYNEI